MPMSPDAMIRYEKYLKEHRDDIEYKNKKAERDADTYGRIVNYLNDKLKIVDISVFPFSNRPNDVDYELRILLEAMHNKLKEELPPLAFAIKMQMSRSAIHKLMSYRTSFLNELIQNFFGPVFSIKLESIQYGSYMDSLEGKSYERSPVYFNMYVEKGTSNDT